MGEARGRRALARTQGIVLPTVPPAKVREYVVEIEKATDDQYQAGHAVLAAVGLAPKSYRETLGLVAKYGMQMFIAQGLEELQRLEALRVAQDESEVMSAPIDCLHPWHIDAVAGIRCPACGSNWRRL